MRIIVADDEYFARRAIVKMIRELSPEAEICLEAEAGREIMDFLEKNPADVIFTDIRMLDGDGLEVSEFVQRNYPDVSVVIISGYADFEYASAAIRYGVEDYLTKPVQKEKLLETLDRIRRKRKARKRMVEEKVESRMELESIRYMNPEEVFAEVKVAESLIGTIREREIDDKDSWQMVSFQILERLTNWSRERLEEQKEYFRQHLERMKLWEYYFYPKEEFLILAAPGQKNSGGGYLPAAVEKMLAALERDRRLHFTAGISAVHQGLDAQTLAEAYRECCGAVNRRHLEPGRRVFLWEQDNSEPQEELVNRILAYVDENYQYEISLTQMANEVFFMNASYLSRVFKAGTGKNFSRYLIEYRMQRAARLLADRSLRISDVAQAVGYNDASYFIRTFKSFYRMTPEQYRAEQD